MMVCATADHAWVQRERERVRRWRSARSSAGRDIGRLPPVADPKRKQAAARSFRLFCLYYFPQTFAKPFSEDHDKVIATIERAVMRGGLFALAMPRGSGKTALCVAAALWAVMYGYHPFVLLVGATGKKAGEMLRSIKTELKTNPLLLADFPEACFPIHALEGIHNRAAGQRFNGQPTYMGWTKEEVVLPTIPGSAASGAIIAVVGILAAARGAQYKRPDGSTVRPSLIIPDDPQTHRSAKSPTQCEDREVILKNDLLRSAGPGEKMTMIIPCTVIAEGDLADRLLNRELNPLFSGIRTKTIYEFPTNMKLWEQYWELRADGFRRGDEGAAATEFYRENRNAMDLGAKVAWEHRVEAAARHRLRDFIDQQIRHHAGIQAARPEQDQLGVVNRFQHFRQGLRIARHAAEVFYFSARFGNIRLALDDRAVFHLRHKLDAFQRGGQHQPADVQDFRRFLNGRIHVARDLAHGG